jgi:hypothetical protein
MQRLFGFLLLCCLLVAAITSCAQPADNTTAKAASFETSNLLIIPAKSGPGEQVLISVSVANTGSAAGEYYAELIVDGAVEGTQTVLIEGGGSQKVAFTVSKDTEGDHTVVIGSQTGKFTVAAGAEGGVTTNATEPQTYTITWTTSEFDSFARMIIGQPAIDYKMRFTTGNKLIIEARMGFASLNYKFDVDICDGKLCFKNVDKQAWDNVFRKGDPYLTYDGKGLMTLMDVREGMPELFAPGLKKLPVIDKVETGEGTISITFTA